MNREIKFRIIYNNIVSGYERLSETGWEWMWLELNPDSGERWTKGAINQAYKLIRTQFTGLHDKNGNEVYDGDILKSIFGHLYTVCWGNDGWKYKSQTEEEGCPLYIKVAANMEIIGNIYQNPKLLTHAQ